MNVGVAAHISGAAAGGPRYNPTLTAAQRSSIKNAIWLCQICAKLVDDDELGHPPSLLFRWKEAAEQSARRRVGKAQRSTTTQPSDAERLLKRDLKLRDDLHRNLVKPWEQVQELRARRGDGSLRPFEKFRYSELVIHRLGDESYPNHDDSPGISGWFTLGTYDFYHNGIKCILRTENGVIEKRQGYAGNLKWAIIPYGADFDRSLFRPIKIWHLGLIPYRNIRHVDLDGDEYYPGPHLYCDFNVNGMPYERFEHAVVATDGEFYDWPLDAALQLAAEKVLRPVDKPEPPTSASGIGA